MEAGMTGRGIGVGISAGSSCPNFDYEMEHSKVESWLDEHPEFFQVLLPN